MEPIREPPGTGVGKRLGRERGGIKQGGRDGWDKEISDGGMEWR